MSRKETVEEWLARGNEITRVDVVGGAPTARFNIWLRDWTVEKAKELKDKERADGGTP